MNLHLSTPVVYTMGFPREPGCERNSAAFDAPEDYGVFVPGTDGSACGTNIQGTGLAAGSVVIDNCISRIFVAAYLLTGRARLAETTLLESIQQLDAASTRGGCLSWKAIVAALIGHADSEDTLDEVTSLLPVELRRVLRLSPQIRQSFVLRVLMAMPRQYCARLLRIEAEQVDTFSCLAAQELARMAANERQSEL